MLLLMLLMLGQFCCIRSAPSFPLQSGGAEVRETALLFSLALVLLQATVG